jgi:hypothetical protein
VIQQHHVKSLIAEPLQRVAEPFYTHQLKVGIFNFCEKLTQ